MSQYLFMNINMCVSRRSRRLCRCLRSSQLMVRDLSTPPRRTNVRRTYGGFFQEFLSAFGKKATADQLFNTQKLICIFIQVSFCIGRTEGNSCPTNMSFEIELQARHCYRNCSWTEQKILTKARLKLMGYCKRRIHDAMVGEYCVREQVASLSTRCHVSNL